MDTFAEIMNQGSFHAPPGTPPVFQGYHDICDLPILNNLTNLAAPDHSKHITFLLYIPGPVDSHHQQVPAPPSDGISCKTMAVTRK